jgi:DNA-binding NtrC family response regulator
MTRASPEGRVLVVDDDPALVRLYCRGLEAAGYAVQGAQDGTEALRIIARGGLDVVVSDIRMPRMGGLDLVIQAQRLVPELAFVLMTAQLDAEGYTRAHAAGVVRYLLKPVGLVQLSRAVANAVQLKASHVKLQERKAR